MKLDKFHEHEALDRLHLALEILQDHINDHPYISSNIELQNKVGHAMNMLMDVYQEIGRKGIN